MNINMAEIFRSVQGEGIYTGVPSVFVRTSGCNLRCRWKNPDGTETRCDTPYASWEPETHLKTCSEVRQEIDALLTVGDHIVVTGGEPTLWAPELSEILAPYQAAHTITVETNGTNAKKLEFADLLSISPKLEAAGNTRMSLEEYAITISDLLAENSWADAQIKFVVSNPWEIEDCVALVKKITKGSTQTITPMLMPQGTTPRALDERLPWLIELAKQLGWRVTDRLHIRAYGNQRGK